MKWGGERLVGLGSGLKDPEEKLVSGNMSAGGLAGIRPGRNRLSCETGVAGLSKGENKDAKENRKHGNAGEMNEFPGLELGGKGNRLEEKRLQGKGKSECTTGGVPETTHVSGRGWLDKKGVK